MREPEDIALRAVAFIAGLLAIICIGLILAFTAHAQDGEFGAWFKSLKVPSTGGSCCDLSDCKRLAPDRVRSNTKGYEVMIEGQWMKVPPKAILQRKGNPTGDAVVCYVPSMGILCFVRPPEA